MTRDLFNNLSGAFFASSVWAFSLGEFGTGCVGLVLGVVCFVAGRN